MPLLQKQSWRKDKNALQSHSLNLKSQKLTM